MQLLTFLPTFLAFAVFIGFGWPLLKTWRYQYAFERTHFKNALEDKATTALRAFKETLELGPVYALASGLGFIVGVTLLLDLVTR